jgi:hypothetical protein
MAYKTKPSLDSLSDLDKGTALAPLAAMKYSDIIHLSYRQALRLWVPLNREECSADRLRHIAALPPTIGSLRMRLEDLEDCWARYHNIAGQRPDRHKYPSIFYNQVWNDARTSKSELVVNTLSKAIETGSPDFIYADGDLVYVG